MITMITPQVKVHSRDDHYNNNHDNDNLDNDNHHHNNEIMIFRWRRLCPSCSRQRGACRRRRPRGRREKQVLARYWEPWCSWSWRSWQWWWCCSHDDHDNDDDDVLMILVQMQERRDRVESDLRKESENLALKLENLKQGHSAESEMYRCQLFEQCLCL